MYLQHKKLRCLIQGGLLQLTAPVYACQQPCCAQQYAAPRTRTGLRSLNALCSLEAHQLVCWPILAVSCLHLAANKLCYCAHQEGAATAACSRLYAFQQGLTHLLKRLMISGRVS